MGTKKHIISLDLGFKLLESKQRFERLFLYDVYPHIFIFRPLTVMECETIFSLVETLDDYIIDDWIIYKAIVSGDIDYLLNSAPAGLANSLAQSVLSCSVVKDPEEMLKLLEKAREENNDSRNILNTMVSMGCGAMLGKETKNITYKQQIKYAALAEEITGKKLENRDKDLPTNRKGKKISSEAAKILSARNADKPDFDKDNQAIKSI